MLKLTSIISGGQTGADRGGLDAAIHLGLIFGGACPEGRRAEDGAIPEKYNTLTALPGSSYEPRTRKNVRDADATIIFNLGKSISGGSHLTRKCAETEGRPCLVVRICRIETGYEEFVEPVAQWLMAVNPAVLNVAGNRESIAPGVQEYVAKLLVGSIARARVMEAMPIESRPATLSTTIDGKGFSAPRGAPNPVQMGLF